METPIARLARRWATRRDRPAGDLPCAAYNCDRTVPEGEGHWLPDARSVACSTYCADTIEADRRA